MTDNENRTDPELEEAEGTEQRPAEETEQEPKQLTTAIRSLVRRCCQGFRPPENMTVSEWADKYRELSNEASAEPGKWRTSRTPYLKEIMDSWNDPNIRHIVVVAASQVGKSEALNNVIGYVIHQDPGSILLIEPTIDDAKKYSKLRIRPMFRDTEVLKKLVRDAKRTSNNTMLEKSYPGGMLIMCGSTEAHALASMPMRYVLGDERDRWAGSAGKEGNPWDLAMARQTTFYNAKSFECSTPTIKGASAIEDAFYTGTQERWCVKCPSCDEYHDIRWKDIRFEYETAENNGKRTFKATKVWHVCPECGYIAQEREIKTAHAKWIAENPAAYETGTRSFWLNAFVSPWKGWLAIVQEFLEAKDDPQRLKVKYNTLFGELWEDRGDLETEDEMMARREPYRAELPDGVLVLTCGVDVQDDRLEYEVVGWGQRDESWGIRRGQLMGDPAFPETWEMLDDILNHVYRYEDGKGLWISITFVDDGGHKTQYTRTECAKRANRHVFDIKGYGGEGIPFTSPPNKVKIMINNRYVGSCYQYKLGVDSGKQAIMNALKVKTPGPQYCHFPLNEEAGYGHKFFVGLLSEHLVYDPKKKNKWFWEKIPGHERNEALDCRNYALAALKTLAPDMDAILARRNGTVQAPARKAQQSKARSQAQARRSIEQRAERMFDW